MNGRRFHYGQQTISQKILAERAGLQKAEVGQIVNVEPDLCVLQDSADQTIKKFQEIGLNFVWNPNRIVIVLDHHVPADSPVLAEAHMHIREFVKRQNIKYFFDISEGACHQVVVERGQILPGQLAVGIDGYVTSYGCLGAFATGVDEAEMAALWATGKIWMKIPPTIKIVVNGRLPRGVYAKDVILFIARKLTSRGAVYKAIEFYGSVISQMTISERFTIANMALELGAKAAVCSFDSITRRYLAGRTKMPYRPALADKDAFYDETYAFNIEHLSPQIACPDSFDNIEAVSQVAGLPVNQVVIGSCTSGRFDDLRIAADVIKDKKIHREVRLLIFPGSRAVYLEALKKGLIRAFVEAGALVLSPGCGPCLGAHQGAVAGGERCLTTTNWNFGRGANTAEAEVYIASPATAAASALKGVITDPTGYVK
ncbi:MAG: 3-isopropylmalate dehydratase large subunit [Candidatus Zixiibacteriota bacterium]|nr:MAG: 3-isopropylmalate dehydratase large subunit [candidate division Zixibacteria bacterium]